MERQSDAVLRTPTLRSPSPSPSPSLTYACAAVACRTVGAAAAAAAARATTRVGGATGARAGLARREGAGGRAGGTAGADGPTGALAGGSQCRPQAACLLCLCFVCLCVVRVSCLMAHIIRWCLRRRPACRRQVQNAGSQAGDAWFVGWACLSSLGLLGEAAGVACSALRRGLSRTHELGEPARVQVDEYRLVGALFGLRSLPKVTQTCKNT